MPTATETTTSSALDSIEDLSSMADHPKPSRKFTRLRKVSRLDPESMPAVSESKSVSKSAEESASAPMKVRML